MKIAYIAGPYRAKNGRTVIENIRAAEQVSIKYWKLGYAVICPHLNTAFFDGLMDDSVWMNADIEFLKRCDVLIAMENHAESAGATMEIKIAQNNGIEIIYDRKYAEDNVS